MASVVRNSKTNKWDISFYFHDWQGKKRHTTLRNFNTKKEALQAADNKIKKYASDCNVKFNVLAENFLEDRKPPTLAETTYYNKCITVRNVLIPYFGQMKINSITPLVIRMWHHTLQDKNLKETTKRQYNLALQGVFDFAVKYYQLAENPVKQVEHIGSMRAPEATYWTLEQFIHYLECFRATKHDARIERKKYPFEVLLSTMFFTGLRPAEMLGLVISDFDKEAKTLKVTKNKIYLGRNKTISKGPKNRTSRRIISLPNIVCNLLTAYIKELGNVNSEHPLFEHIFHSTKSISNMLNRGYEEAKVPRLTPHKLRHSHASLLIHSNGLDAKLLSQRLGHSSVKVTLDTYVHCYDGDNKTLAEEINNIVDRNHITI